ncbi:hypothetical protein [Streptomyces sp. NPDC127098]|uniref:hypothetical protein n=1 Tax=Streptomyces sp. NPDC127098 TaxID=3347137 RepID=UPI003666E251
MRARALACGVLLAAVVSLTACGGGDDGGRAASEPESERTATATEGPEAAGDEATAGATPDAGAGTGPTDDGVPDETVPEGELTPAEGEFAEEEREYLTDRVPVGADPAAILEMGDEACYRIGYLERHDREGAVRALREGEIPDAAAAVEHLCPEYAELLAEAESEAATEE